MPPDANKKSQCCQPQKFIVLEIPVQSHLLMNARSGKSARDCSDFKQLAVLPSGGGQELHCTETGALTGGMFKSTRGYARLKVKIGGM